MISLDELIGDVWTGVDKFALPDDVQGWNSDFSIFDDLASEAMARSRGRDRVVAIEVGSWKGRSAIHIAKALIEANAERKRAEFSVDSALPTGRDLFVYCVDTWQGGIDHLLSDLPHDRLPRRNGASTLYEQFLWNCLKANVSSLIRPLPMPSSIAAKLLAAHEIVADFVYVDGDHTHDGCFADLVAYWALLRPGGVLFGDDVNFPGVHSAVARFMDVEGLDKVVVTPPFWRIEKPKAS